MEDVEVLSVTRIARTTNAETAYMVVFAFESAVVHKIENDEIPKAQIKLDIPGVPERAPTIPLENKVILLLSPEEWRKCQNKFIVGSSVSLKIEKDGSIKIG